MIHVVLTTALTVSIFLAGWRKRRPELGISFVRFRFAYMSSFHWLLFWLFVLSLGCS